MNAIQTAIELNQLISSGHTFFFKSDPEVFDFTDPGFSGKLVFYSATQELTLQVSGKGLVPLLGLLKAALIGNKDLTLVGWNVKNFNSFVKFHTRCNMEWLCKVFDLKLLESFLGITRQCPANFAEMIYRLKCVVADPSWAKVKSVWQKIHTPLVFEVIPALETQGIYNGKERKALYSYYEIEGQANGRLKCSKEYKHSYVPHTMGPEQRELFRPKGTDEVFMYFDYSNMEVAMLQWLSKDDRLGDILELDEDFYKVVFKLVAGSTCDTEKKRDMCKKFILPVIYGESASALAAQLGVSQNTAESIISRVYGLFPKSLKWVQNFQNEVADMGTDYFGRRRYFKEGNFPVRNFSVQSPAALFCLEKLIALYNKIKGYAKLACSIHDGYVVYAGKSSVKMVGNMGREVLEQDSDLCPGIKLKCTCKFGGTLAELSLLN